MVHRALIIYGLGFGTGVILTIWVAVSVAGGKPTAYPVPPARVITVVSVVTATSVPIPRQIAVTLLPVTPTAPALSGGSASQGTAITRTPTALEGLGTLATLTPIALAPTTTHIPTPNITPRPTPREGGPTTTELRTGPLDESQDTPVWTCGSPTPVGFPFRHIPPGC